MTKQHAGAIGMAIATLVEGFGVKDITDVRIRVYEKALSKLPEALLRPMVDRALETRTPRCKDWLPSVQELLSDADACRKAIVAAHPYEGCAACEDSRGLIEVVGDDGIRRAQPCPCKARWREKLAQLGVGTGERIALPAARDWSEPESAA